MRSPWVVRSLPSEGRGNQADVALVLLFPIESGLEGATMDEMLEVLEQQREGNLARDIFGDDDDVGYFDCDNDWDDRINAADGAFDPEALESCWDKSG